MNQNIHPDTSRNQLPEAADEVTRRAADAVKESANRAETTANEFSHAIENMAEDALYATKDTLKLAKDKAKDVYHSAAVKAEDTLVGSREFVRRNPFRVVLGAIAFGAAIGCMATMAGRRSTFIERYADEPIGTVRDAILSALAPVAHRVHEGYDSARDGAGKVLDRVHSFGPGRRGSAFSRQIGRIGNNLKFW